MRRDKPRSGDRWGRWLYEVVRGRPTLEHVGTYAPPGRFGGFMAEGWWTYLDDLDGGALGLLQTVARKTWASREDVGDLFKALDDLGYVTPTYGTRKERAAT